MKIYHKTIRTRILGQSREEQVFVKMDNGLKVQEWVAYDDGTFDTYNVEPEPFDRSGFTPERCGYTLVTPGTAEFKLFQDMSFCEKEGIGDLDFLELERAALNIATEVRQLEGVLFLLGLLLS